MPEVEVDPIRDDVAQSDTERFEGTSEHLVSQVIDQEDRQF